MSDIEGKELIYLRNIDTGEVSKHYLTDAEYYDMMRDDMTVVLPDGSLNERYFPQPKELGKKRPWARPFVSVAAGVHPSQAQEFTEAARKKGFTGVSFNADGDAVFTTRRQRSEYLRDQGMCDRDAGYSD